MDLSPELKEAIKKMGFEKPSPIQSGTIPLLLNGRDIIGQAQTGTGKTAAFGIPMIQAADAGDRSIQSVVLCPTRELAIQVSEELKKLSSGKKSVKILPVYGGESIQIQLKALKRGVHVVVGTPGRVMDHMKRGTIKFDQVKMVVLDEADEMLNMGFLEDIEHILSAMPEKRQTVLFSATMPSPILKIAERFQNDPELIKVTREELTGSNISQYFYDISASDKLRLIERTMKAYGHQLAIVFCNTRIQVDNVASALTQMGIHAAGIHGDLNQAQRNKVLSSFKNGPVSVLVATDVAARGLDVNNVDAVFNYDIPLDPEYYVHRIGRTGRAGKTGQSFSFVSGSNDFRKLKRIESYAKVQIERLDAPSLKEIYEQRKRNLFFKLEKLRDENIPEVYFSIMDEFIEKGISHRQLSAALLSVLLPEPDKEDEIPTRKSGRQTSKEGRPSKRKFREKRPFVKSGKGKPKKFQFKRKSKR